MWAWKHSEAFAPLPQGRFRNGARRPAGRGPLRWRRKLPHRRRCQRRPQAASPMPRCPFRGCLPQRQSPPPGCRPDFRGPQSEPAPRRRLPESAPRGNGREVVQARARPRLSGRPGTRAMSPCSGRRPQDDPAGPSSSRRPTRNRRRRTEVAQSIHTSPRLRCPGRRRETFADLQRCRYSRYMSCSDALKLYLRLYLKNR